MALFLHTYPFYQQLVRRYAEKVLYAGKRRRNIGFFNDFLYSIRHRNLYRLRDSVKAQKAKPAGEKTGQIRFVQKGTYHFLFNLRQYDGCEQHHKHLPCGHYGQRGVLPRIKRLLALYDNNRIRRHF